MQNPQNFEKAYEEFTCNLGKWLHDGILEVDLNLLKKLDLLKQTDDDEADLQQQFPFYFHVIETQEKVTLFNNQFVVWIIPKLVEEVATTLTIISLIHDNTPRMEIAFSTSGVYNTPKYVLRVLRHFLTEVIETEEEIASIGRNNP